MERALNDARAKRCLFLEPASFTATSRVGANGAALDQVSWRFTSGGFPAESLKSRRRRSRIRRRQESSAESGPTSLSLGRRHFPSPLVGEGGASRSEATGEGSVSADTECAVRDPSSGASRHLLPQREKGRALLRF